MVLKQWPDHVSKCLSEWTELILILDHIDVVPRPHCIFHCWAIRSCYICINSAQHGPTYPHSETGEKRQEVGCTFGGWPHYQIAETVALGPTVTKRGKSMDTVEGSMHVTGWDSQALQAATIEWQGEGTCMALVVMSGLFWLVLSYMVHTPPPIALMCNLGNVPLAQYTWLKKKKVNGQQLVAIFWCPYSKMRLNGILLIS